jgi:Na+/H+ antiporter NhaD/arsenite permease-like protein
MLSESIAATVVFFGSALWFRKEDHRHQELFKLVQDLQRPVLAESAHFDPSGFRVYYLLGKICVVLGLVLMVCIVVPSTETAPAFINIVGGGGLLALGTALLYFSRER